MAQNIDQIRKKKFTYRGNDVEKLKQLNIREFARYLKSRQRRTVLRNFRKIDDFVNKAKRRNTKGQKIKTHERNIVIVPEMIEMKIHVYNGKEFIPIEIKPEMLGHTLGEFASTRGKVEHGTAGVGATKGTKFKAKK